MSPGLWNGASVNSRMIFVAPCCSVPRCSRGGVPQSRRDLHGWEMGELAAEPRPGEVVPSGGTMAGVVLATEHGDKPHSPRPSPDGENSRTVGG